MIIRPVRHRGLRRLIERNDPRFLRQDLVDRIRKILTALIVAEDIDEFVDNAPKGWRVHQLTGDRKDTWSVSTSGNFRVTFDEESGGVDHLDLEDYH